MIQTRYRPKDAHRPAPNGTVNANTRQAAGNLCTVIDTWDANLIVGFQAGVVLIFVQIEPRETNTQFAQKRSAERVRVVHRQELVFCVGCSRIATSNGRSTGYNTKHAGALEVRPPIGITLEELILL